MNRLISLVLQAVGLPIWCGARVIGAAPPDPPHIGILTPLPESASDRDLIVDLRLARELKIDVPRELRASADKVIK